MSDFTDQITADAMAIFLNLEEFAETLTVTLPDGTVFLLVGAFPLDLPDSDEEEKRTYFADDEVAGLTWSKDLKVVSDRDGFEWRIESTGMNELGLSELNLLRPLSRD